MVSSAQKTLGQEGPQAQFKKALDLFDHEKYGPAQKVFQQVVDDPSLAENEFLYHEARYYNALSTLKLFNPDGQKLMAEFVDAYPQGARKEEACFYLGQYYFHIHRYREAIAWYNRTNTSVLTQEQTFEYKFQLAYANFYRRQLDTAQPLFKEIKDTPNKYFYPSNYYYGYIAYKEKDYDEALGSFLKISSSQMYGNTAPYYITQLYFLKGMYKKVISYGVPILQREKLKFYYEINHLIGQAYFNQKQYSEAVPYLSKFVEKSSKVKKHHIYQLGFAQYQAGNYEAAIGHFTELVPLRDSMAQNSLYNLADCYLKTDQRQNARNAFIAATKYDFDHSITEISYVNYAKLSLELGYHRIAIKSARTFIKDYPKSEYLTEVQELLTDIFLSTRNYEAALELIQSIKDKSPKIMLAFQRVAFYRGVQLYTDMKFNDALTMFDLSLSQPIEVELQAMAYFWKGEIHYINRKLQHAITSYNQYLGMAKLIKKPMPEESSLPMVNYAIGYCYLMQNDHASAVAYFAESIKGIKNDQVRLKAKILPDATMRAADSYFMLKQYAKAVTHYEKAIKLNEKNIDYALFQRGMLYGLMDNDSKKIESMENILENHHRSMYLDDAIYEMALSYHNKEDWKNAIDRYLMLTRKYPNSGYVPQAYLRLGLIHVNQSKTDDALAYYKEVVTGFPKTPESQEALAGIKEIYIGLGKADEYITYLKAVPEAELRSSEEDSLTYMSAENVFAKGNCEKSVEAFTKYITRFPDGYFAVQAHFYKGECLYKAKDYEESFADYDYVISQKPSMFSERALVKASRIAYHIRKDNSAAYKLYTKLETVAEYKGNMHEAIVGAMRSAFALADAGDSSFYQPTIEYATKVVSLSGVAPEDAVSAAFYTGRAYYAKGNTDSAVSYFERTISMSDNIQAAEAQFHIADIQFSEEEYKASKASCFNIIQQTPSYYHWIVKSYILLADNYRAEGDLFQAKATLQSIVDNYDGEDDELLELARGKLDAIIEQEMEESRVVEDSTNQFLVPETDSSDQQFEAVPDSLEMPIETPGIPEENGDGGDDQ